MSCLNKVVSVFSSSIEKSHLFQLVKPFKMSLALDEIKLLGHHLEFCFTVFFREKTSKVLFCSISQSAQQTESH